MDICVTEFRAHCLEPIRQVNCSGEEVLITRHGIPVARLTPPSMGLATVPSPWLVLRGSGRLDAEPEHSLLDTDVWLWWLLGSERLEHQDQRSLDRLAASSPCAIGAMSLWRAQMLHAKRRLCLDQLPQAFHDDPADADRGHRTGPSPLPDRAAALLSQRGGAVPPWHLQRDRRGLPLWAAWNQQSSCMAPAETPSGFCQRSALFGFSEMSFSTFGLMPAIPMHRTRKRSCRLLQARPIVSEALAGRSTATATASRCRIGWCAACVIRKPPGITIGCGFATSASPPH